MRKIKRIAILILLLAVLITVLQNADPVRTYLVFTNVELPLSLLLLITLLIGFGLGLIISVKFRAHGKNGAN